jgi:hypothetical protein
MSELVYTLQYDKRSVQYNALAICPVCPFLSHCPSLHFVTFHLITGFTALVSYRWGSRISLLGLEDRQSTATTFFDLNRHS